MKHMLSSPEKQIIYQSHYSVENFFFIRYLKMVKKNKLLINLNILFSSGLLTTYITLKHTDGKYENLNKFGFLILRFVRLTPQLAIFILLNFLLPLMSSGPVWRQQIQPIIKNCHNNWWQNLLYLQNLIDVQNTVSFK